MLVVSGCQVIKVMDCELRFLASLAESIFQGVHTPTLKIEKSFLQINSALLIVIQLNHT